jgi:hypothetical protein
MEQTNEAKLKDAIRSVITKHPEFSDREVARAVFSDEPALIAEWAMEKVTAAARMLRPKSADTSQLAFPFHDLSVQIPVKDGRREIRDATIGILRQSERVLLKKARSAKPRSNSLLGRIQREIELMEPWAYSNRRITVGQVQQLIAGGAPQPAPVKTSKMSDAMKRYWEGKTPEERSAIARRRQRKRKLAGN